MRILHYALGFPPYRSGGLTKFCIDLMAQQSKEGHTVAMLWPGEMCYFNHVPMIKKHNDVKLAKQLVQSFELVNPLPVPLDEGIADIAAFIKDDGKKAYERLIKCFRPDVIHVHTLMGIHKSFLDTARERGVRLVFSAHDFFPICSKVTMYHNNTLCNCVRDCGNCGVCNITALNLRKIQILQSPLYRGLKDSALVKKLRTKHRTRYLSKAGSDISAKSVAKASQYQELREYYYALLKMMDLIHYNSSVTKAVYETYFTFSNTRSITITHSGILDKRARKSFSEDTIRIRYLGPQSAGKGFYLLESALDMLWNERKNFCLDVHFTPIEKNHTSKHMADMVMMN